MDVQSTTKYCMEKIKQCGCISDKMIDYFSYTGDKYIFGTSRQAAVCMEICRYMQVNIAGIISEDFIRRQKQRVGYWKQLVESVPTISIEQVVNKSENAYILMAVGEANYVVVEEKLRSYGLNNIYRCEWRSNRDLRDICYEVYKEQYDKWKEAQMYD